MRPAGRRRMMKEQRRSWQKSRMELFRDLDCGEEGLSAAEAAKRLEA